MISEALARDLEGRPSTSARGPFDIAWSKGRFRRLEGSNDFSNRSLVLVIGHEGRRLAQAEFRQWRSRYAQDDAFSFVNAADAASQADYEFANALANAVDWTIWDPFDGDPVCFESLYMASDAHAHGDLWQVIRNEIRRTFSNTGSVLMLQPFPIESSTYHERAKAPGDDERMKRRAAAMLRHYRTRLGVVEAGDTGWMAAPLGDAPIRIRPPGCGEPFRLGDEWLLDAREAGL